ncbi:MAG TPA: YCF48-related protein, partial [Actinomycetota bacterium]|nr:YCF48-related protein [Actinomycetota bacterium]
WVVVGDPPILYRTDDGGSTWRRFPIGAGQHVTSIAAVDGNRAWLTSYRGRRGTLFLTMNGGRSWRAVTPVA